MYEAAARLETILQASEVRKIKNEKFRLLNERTFPLTKSENKFICVGVRALRDYEAVVKIFNPQLTRAATFTKTEFDELIRKLQDYISLVRNVENEVLLCELTKYSVYMCKNKIQKLLSGIKRNEKNSRKLF